MKIFSNINTFDYNAKLCNTNAVFITFTTFFGFCIFDRVIKISPLNSLYLLLSSFTGISHEYKKCISNYGSSQTEYSVKSTYIQLGGCNVISGAWIYIQMHVFSGVSIPLSFSSQKIPSKMSPIFNFAYKFHVHILSGNTFVLHFLPIFLAYFSKNWHNMWVIFSIFYYFSPFFSFFQSQKLEKILFYRCGNTGTVLLAYVHVKEKKK